MTQMTTDYHDDLVMKKIFAFFASLREIIEFFQWTQFMVFTNIGQHHTRNLFFLQYHRDNHVCVYHYSHICSFFE